jgi:hypothetical protein
MSANPPHLNSLRAFLEEHQKLTRRIAELRRWWSELDELGIRKFGEMASRVQELRDLLAAHFAEEESGGYLSSALAAAPEFTAQAAALGGEHAQFLERLDHLIARLRDSEETSHFWRTARAGGRADHCGPPSARASRKCSGPCRLPGRRGDP